MLQDEKETLSAITELPKDIKQHYTFDVLYKYINLIYPNHPRSHFDILFDLFKWLEDEFDGNLEEYDLLMLHFLTTRLQPDELSFLDNFVSKLDLSGTIERAIDFKNGGVKWL